METLIQTEKCSIVYGDFKGEHNQELFRCPRELDNTDLVRYINENRCVVGLVDDISVIDDLSNIKGKQYVGQWRMYFRGDWYGRWIHKEKELMRRDCVGVDKIIEVIKELFPHGCDWQMKDYCCEHFTERAEHRYLIKPKLSEVYKILIDTTYGNEDYPIRIFVYH